MKLDKDKVKAVFLLSAIGDALGVPLETKTRDAINAEYGRVADYVTNPTHQWYGAWEKGRWSDDTQLSLVIARSLVARKGIDLDDLARRHIAAYDECNVGWGGSTKESIQRLKAGVSPQRSGAGVEHGRGKGKGNGVAMKIAPLALYYAARSGTAAHLHRGAKESIRDVAAMTHRTEMGVASALAQVVAIQYCLSAGEKFSAGEFAALVHKAALIGERSRITLIPDNSDDMLSDRLWKLAHVPSWEGLTDDNIAEHFGNGSCYVYESLPVAYALFLRNPHSIEALYDAVNFGEDTDTIASMVGALLGAQNGTRIIPHHLLEGLWHKDEVVRTAEEFYTAFGIE